MEVSGEKHKRAFKKWRTQLPAKTKLLTDAVVGQLIPQLEQRGFIWVDDLFERGKVSIGRADVIAMTRQKNEYLDNVVINFSKKRYPFFSISFRRWSKTELAQGEMWWPHFLSKWKSEKWRAKKFGFSSFDPFITSNRCKKIVSNVITLLPQMDECFENGKVGSNITETERMGKKLSTPELKTNGVGLD